MLKMLCRKYNLNLTNLSQVKSSNKKQSINYILSLSPNNNYAFNNLIICKFLYCLILFLPVFFTYLFTS